jgi:hypothetical protein
MSDPTNEPSREPICEPTNDRINDQTTHEMNEQTEVPLQQLGTHANVSQQLIPAANSEGVKVASKTAHQLPTSSHSTNNLWQCQSFVDNVLIDSWQCLMKIDKVKSMKTAQRAIGSKCKSYQSCGHCYDKNSEQVGNSASTQLVGSCHGKKSERVGNCASTQLVGSCHDKKSERAGCIASTQQDSTFQLIVGFKQYNQSLTRKSRQRRSFVDNVLINLWQCRMEINNVKPQLIDSWQC